MAKILKEPADLKRFADGLRHSIFGILPHIVVYIWRVDGYFTATRDQINVLTALRPFHTSDSKCYVSLLFVSRQSVEANTTNQKSSIPNKKRYIVDHAPVWSVGGVLISLSVAVSP